MSRSPQSQTLAELHPPALAACALAGKGFAVPGRADRQWRWRCTATIPDEPFQQLYDLTAKSDRLATRHSEAD